MLRVKQHHLYLEPFIEFQRQQLSLTPQVSHDWKVVPKSCSAGGFQLFYLQVVVQVVVQLAEIFRALLVTRGLFLLP